MGYSSLVGSDGVHPTIDGYNTLAENVLSMLQGNGLARGKKINLIANNNWDISLLNVLRGEDFIRIYGSAVANKDITPSDTKICDVDFGAPYAGIVISMCPSGSNFVNVEFTPSLELNNYQRGHIDIQYDYGETITNGTPVVINELIPILNL